jgi:hypothetical protein
MQIVSLSRSRNLKNLDYSIIAGKAQRHASQAEIDLNNQAFEFWRTFWAKVYGDAGSPESLVCDDFLRQEMVTIIRHEKKIVGLHLYSFFNLEQQAIKLHRYFQFYPEKFFEYLRQTDVKEVMSLEFLTIDPEWRKSVTGVSLAEVLIACATKCIHSHGADAGIAPARTDNKVNQMAYHQGYECFQAGITKRNFQVDLIVGFKDQLKATPNPEVNSLADKFWRERNDFTGLTQSLQNVSKIA